MNPSSGWIAVDLDGTLAEYDHWRGVEHIGDPIRPMVTRVKSWLDKGLRVKIFTARASVPEAVPHIVKWCQTHLGHRLEVTDRKDMDMRQLWDDRAVTVEFNTGKILTCGI